MRRRVLTRRGGYSLAALAIVFVSALGMLVFDSIQRYPLSIEVQQLRTENQQLREVLSQSNTLLPEINNKRERLALIYSQVWAKTGLGVKPPVLPVGPVDADPHVSLSMGAVVTQGIDAETPAL
ncbi:hypothetical protein KAI87_10115 [Myxococcota bacterium]|nr:hypothetical protein [Myxococcota bacterium]